MSVVVGMFILFGITVVFFIVSLIIDITNKTESRLLNIISWIFLLLTIAGMASWIALPVCAESKFEKSHWVVESKPYSVEYIVALNDDNQINGRFCRYMRRGYIEEVLYYQYMVKCSDGGYVANKMPASQAVIYTADKNYRVEWYNKSRSWWIFKQTTKHNKIYIPDGSIVENYNIDLN